MVYVRVGTEWVYQAKGETVEQTKARGQKLKTQYGSASVQNRSVFEKERGEAQVIYTKQQIDSGEAQRQAESMARGEELRQRSMANAPMSTPSPVYVPPKRPEIITTSVYDRPSEPLDYLTGYGYGMSGLGSIKTTGGEASGYITQHGKKVTEFKETGRTTRLTQYPYLVTDEGKTISEPRVIITKQYPSPAVERGEQITQKIWSFATEPDKTLISMGRTFGTPLAFQIAGPQLLQDDIVPSMDDLTRSAGLGLYVFTLGTTAHKVFAPSSQKFEYESPVKVKVKATSGREQIFGESTYKYKVTSPEKLVLDDTGAMGISRSVKYTVGKGEIAQVGKVKLQELGGEIIDFGPDRVVLRKLGGGGVGDSIDLGFEILANVESKSLGKMWKPSGKASSSVISYLTDTYYPPTTKISGPDVLKNWLGGKGTVLKTGVKDTLTGLKLKLSPTATTQAQIMSAERLQRFGLFDVRPVPKSWQGVYDVPQSADMSAVIPLKSQGLDVKRIQGNIPQFSTRMVPQFDTDLKLKVLQRNVPLFSQKESMLSSVSTTQAIGQTQLISPKNLQVSTGLSRTGAGADMSAPASFGFKFPTPKFGFRFPFPTLQLPPIRRTRPEGRQKTRRTQTRSFFYVPSLTSILGNVIAPMPKKSVFSGAELRPFPKKRRKKRRK